MKLYESTSFRDGHISLPEYNCLPVVVGTELARSRGLVQINDTGPEISPKPHLLLHPACERSLYVEVGRMLVNPEAPGMNSPYFPSVHICVQDGNQDQAYLLS